MKAKKEFGELKEFEGLSVSLYRSSDKKSTERYFTNRRGEELTGNSFFELLYFKYNYDKLKHLVYLKYPDTDYFVELYSGGSSSQGSMESISVKDIWEADYKNEVKIKIADSNLFLGVGKGTYESAFNFMTLVGRFSENEYYFRDSEFPSTFNVEEIDQALSKKYIKIPDSIRKIQYLMKLQLPSYDLKEVDKLELELNKKQVIYFVVDYPAYNFNYTNHRFRIVRGKSVEECEVKDFVRYRDGGTTIITVIDSKGKEHTFFSPTNLWDPKDKKNSTWDKQILVENVSKEEREKIVSLLDIDVVPAPKED
jgi:hypothetical protein